MRLEAGRAEVLGICHSRRPKKVRPRRVRAFRWWLTALIGEQAASLQKAVDSLSLHAVECLRPNMAKKQRYQNRIELLQGTLDLLILQTLQWGPQHGYGISQSIRGRSGEVLQVETGSLYPALHRLEKQGWVNSQWKQSESNQRAKYYRLTPAGKRQLLSEQARWTQIVTAIAGIVKPAADGG